MTDWKALAVGICYPNYEKKEEPEVEICIDCRQPIEDYGDPHQLFEGPLCAACYGEWVSD